MGDNVLVALPQHGVPEIGAAIEAALESFCRPATLELEGGDPVDMLFNAAGIVGDTCVDRTLLALCTMPEFDGVAFLVDGIEDEPELDHWLQFVEAYAHTARNNATQRQSCVTVTLVRGPLAARFERGEDRTSSIGIAVCRWDAIVTELDMLVYAEANITNCRSDPRESRAVLRHTLAALAQYDPTVIEAFADDDAAIFSPEARLQEIAAYRGWSTETPEAWYAGAAMVVDGKRRAHSALPNAWTQLTERIWRAQVVVLYPAIEDYRRALIRKYSRFLYAPFEPAPSSQVVVRKSDLEIAHICRQLKQAVARGRLRLGDQTLLENLEVLRRMRNNLAHSQSVDLSDHSLLEALALVELNIGESR